jgi:hypothetical protein
VPTPAFKTIGVIDTSGVERQMYMWDVVGDGSGGFAQAVAIIVGAAAATVQGDTADSATDAGNPVKIGAVYNSTAPTYSSGQRTTAQSDTRGNIKVYLATTIDSTNDQIALGANSAGGWTPYHRLATGSDNVNVKNTAGAVCSLTLINYATGGARHVKFYNKASAPTPASDTPVYTFCLPAATSATQPTVVAFSGPPAGLQFSTGISYAIVVNESDTDNTAASANDVSVNLGYL